MQRIYGVRTDHSARIGVPSATQTLRRSDPALYGHFAVWDERHRVADHQPADGPILATSDSDTTLRRWLDVVRDAVNQDGRRAADQPGQPPAVAVAFLTRVRPPTATRERAPKLGGG